jgi:catechol 2,3-dioxygenase-like lactoylglutathione lyase family enzyme
MNSEPRDWISPVLPVGDVRASCEHLRDKLGFTVEEQCSGDRDWAIVQKGRSAIVLVPRDWPTGCEIRVADVDQVFDELAAFGAEFESGPMNQEYGQRDFVVRGPEGSMIRFWSILKKDS